MPSHREAARYDPTEFVAAKGLLAIDEVQRVPELLLAVGARNPSHVDRRPCKLCGAGSQGGFPEGIERPPRGRERFFDSYLSDLVNRDVIQLSEIERGPEMRALIRLLAIRSGQLLVSGSLGNDLGLSRQTVNRYLSLSAEVFLIKRIPAWSRNLDSRAVAAPKSAFVDSGIAANLLDMDDARLRQPGGHLRPLLEGSSL